MTSLKRKLPNAGRNAEEQGILIFVTTHCSFSFKSLRLDLRCRNGRENRRGDRGTVVLVWALYCLETWRSWYHATRSLHWVIRRVGICSGRELTTRDRRNQQNAGPLCTVQWRCSYQLETASRSLRREEKRKEWGTDKMEYAKVWNRGIYGVTEEIEWEGGANRAIGVLRRCNSLVDSTDRVEREGRQ